MGGSALLDIRRLFESVGLSRGMRVADFGASGSGHLVFPAAERVGKEGQVYAVNLDQAALDLIEGRRRQYLVHNIDTVWGDIEQANGVAIDERSLDLVFLVNVMWTLRDQLEMVKESRRLLVPNGKIVVLDWLPGTTHPVAPPSNLRVQPNVSDVYFLSGGCSVCDELRPTPWHWGRIYGRV